MRCGPPLLLSPLHIGHPRSRAAGSNAAPSHRRSGAARSTSAPPYRRSGMVGSSPTPLLLSAPRPCNQLSGAAGSGVAPPHKVRWDKLCFFFVHLVIIIGVIEFFICAKICDSNALICVVDGCRMDEW